MEPWSCPRMGDVKLCQDLNLLVLHVEAPEGCICALCFESSQVDIHYLFPKRSEPSDCFNNQGTAKTNLRDSMHHSCQSHLSV